MSLPSIVSYGAAAKTSSLVWDGDLVIPDGYSIESASGDVGFVGDVSVSGSVSADGAISAGGGITVDGYTPQRVVTTGTFSYSGNGNDLIFIPVVPQTGVLCSGSAVINIISAGPERNIKLYARCYSLCGKTADLLLGVIDEPAVTTINISNVLIPATTQFINGFYLVCVNAKAEITSIDITTASYTSKLLI